MASVSAPPRARRARRAPSPAAPPVAAPPTPERHGTCSLTLSIGGTSYALRPCPPPPGLSVVWTLRKLAGPEPVAYAVASDGQATHCTCPDHEHNKASCNHMMALMALGLVPRPQARPGRPSGPPSPADQFRAAVQSEVARISAALPEGWQHGGAAVPAPAPPVGDEICDECGAAFDMAVSRHPFLCGPCAKGGAL